MAIDKTKVGIIDCGKISRAYFTGTIRWRYGVPAHITYGAPVFGSASCGYCA